MTELSFWPVILADFCVFWSVYKNQHNKFVLISPLLTTVYKNFCFLCYFGTGSAYMFIGVRDGAWTIDRFMDCVLFIQFTYRCCCGLWDVLVGIPARL